MGLGSIVRSGINSALQPLDISLARASSLSDIQKRVDNVQSRLEGRRSAFSFEEAQKYELAYADGIIKKDFPSVLAGIEQNKRMGGEGGRHTWFDDGPLWGEFVMHAKHRKCLDIGCGPWGYIFQLPWIERRVVIDPLASAYRRSQLEHHSRTLFTTDIEIHSMPAEVFIPQLSAAIDGCIISSNMLDHTADPLRVIENISRYAAPGCWLLLRTEIWHNAAPDEGHRDITRSITAIDALLSGLGFDVIMTAENNSDQHLSIARVARKVR